MTAAAWTRSPGSAWVRSRTGARAVGIVSTLAVVALVELLIAAGAINAFVVPKPTQILLAIPRIIARRTCCTGSGRRRRKSSGQACCSPCSGSRWARCCSASSVAARVRSLGRRARRRADRAHVPALSRDLRAQHDDDRDDRFRAGLAPVILKTVDGTVRHAQGADRRRPQLQAVASQQFWKVLLPAALPAVFVGLKLGLIFAMINIVGVEFLINFGGLGQLINELAERYDLPARTARSCS
jgi:hypothetical protein